MRKRIIPSLKGDAGFEIVLSNLHGVAVLHLQCTVLGRPLLYSAL